MGIVITKEFNEQTGEQQELAMPVELDHGIAAETSILHTLRHWSLRDIREMLEKFLARNYQKQATMKTMNIIQWYEEFECDKNAFKHIMNVTNNEAEAIFNAFDNYSNHKKINLLQFAAPMIVTAWGATEDKYEFTFTLFNSDDDDQLDKSEFSVIVRSFVNGFRRWGQKKTLEAEDLQPLSDMLFDKIDIDQSKAVDLKECSDVMKNLPDIRDVFLKQEKGTDTQYHDNVLKKRLTSFAVYKVHSVSQKKPSNIRSISTKKESEDDRLNKASIAVKDNKATMKQKAKGIVKREIQEKLKNLYALFKKIIDENEEAQVKKDNKQEKKEDLSEDDYQTYQIKKDDLNEYFDNNESSIDKDILVKLSKHIYSSSSCDQQGLQAIIKFYYQPSINDIHKDYYEWIKKDIEDNKDEDKGDKVNAEQDKQWRPIFLKISKGKVNMDRSDFLRAFKDLDDTNFNLGDYFDKISVDDGIDQESFLKIMLKKDKLKQVKPIEITVDPKETEDDTNNQLPKDSI